MIFRPATPGFIVTLVATGLLAAVSFSVPYIKSVFFLKATLVASGVNSTFTFGVLGYCVEVSSNTTCSSPSVGWEFNPNQLLGDDTIIQIPSVVVKWITYVLVLHIVGLILAAISAVFGLLAHVREMSMTCFSSCISGFAATVTMIAFFFDIGFFFLVKSRIDSVSGGAAVIGTGLWLTLIAWILLFFSGCFYRFGRCCIGSRPRGPREKNNDPEYNRPAAAANPNYGDQLRLDAVKAEADRKARQKQSEGGLPAFAEYDQATPLTSEPRYLEEEEVARPYRDNDVAAGVAGAAVGAGAAAAYGRRQGSQTSNMPAGYAPGAAGTRAVDEYYNPTTQQNSYPPQPQRQGSGHSQALSGYAPSGYNNALGAGMAGAGAGLAAGAAHDQYQSQYNHNQYLTQDYGHNAGGTSYHSAATHQQYPTAYSQNLNTYPDQGYQPQPSTFNSETYNTTGAMSHTAYDPYANNNLTARPPINALGTSYNSDQSGGSQYYTPANNTPGVQERSYTLGGGGYGESTVPDAYAAGTSYAPNPHSPPPLNTNVPGASGPTSPRGPRGPRTSVYSSPTNDDLPVYDEGTAQPPGVWNSKR